MALAEDISTLRNTKPRNFDQWLEWADPTDRELVMEAVMDDTIPPNPLAVMLSTKHHIPITRETIVKLRDSRG